MSIFTRLLIRSILFAAFVSTVSYSASAATRMVNTGAERSLLYWRYLCENNIQTETVKNGLRTLSCPSQHWTVKAKESEDVVREVENDE